MNAVFQEAISSHNLPLTIVLGIVALYWLISLAGVIDFDALDGALGLDTDAPDLDVDMDVDVDIETEGAIDTDGNADGADTDGDHHHHESVGLLQTAMRVLGVTDAPIMFVLTVYILTLWGCNVLGNIYFNSVDSGSTAAIILGSSLAGSFILTRLLVRPLRPVMKLLRDTEKRAPLVGMSGEVRSLTVTQSSGQVEVVRDGAPILLHARVGNDREPITRGTEVLIVLKQEDDAYLVRPLSEVQEP